jgi:hypothetical protein
MHQSAQQKEMLQNLLMEIECEFDSETPPQFTTEQAKVIATAFYLLQSRANITQVIDQLIMLLSIQDPELDWARHTFKNLARFLNVANHPLLTQSTPC